MEAVSSTEVLIWSVRVAGGLHFVTLVLACMTPIPPQWSETLAALPDVHRRFALAQNIFIGGVIAVCGSISMVYAADLVAGSRLAQGVAGAIALWWGGRLVVLPWLRVRPHLTTPWLKIGFVLLHIQCAVFALGYAWLALR